MTQSPQSSFSPSSTIRTFSEYQEARRARLDQVNADLQAQKDREIQDLHDTLNDLMVRLGAAHDALQSEEKVFLERKESLSTELKTIKINADIAYAKARTEHVTELGRLEDDLERALSEMVRALPGLDSPNRPADIPDPLRAGISRSPYKSRVEINDLDSDEDNDQLYADRIQQLEQQKHDLIQMMKDDERNNQGRLTEITSMMDVQEAQCEQEIKKIQEKMKAKEEHYYAQLNNLYAELQRAKDRRKAAADKRIEKVAALQAQIDRVESEYKEKIRQANKVAEKLKASLTTANLKKSQQLELEKRRTEESRLLNEESLSLQQQVFEMQKDLQRAKEESQLRRRELSAQIGARRTASLFP